MTFSAILLALISAGALDSQSPTQDYKQITVDAGRVNGHFKQLQGFNGVPDMRFADPKLVINERRALNVSEMYRQAHVTLVRTHDAFSAGDIDRAEGPLPPIKTPMPMGPITSQENVIFRDLAADPNDTKSYNFVAADKMVLGIRNIGADVLFRLGREATTTAPPPADLKKYQEIVRHIVLHFNKGWDHGFQESVKYWEFWNEPDIAQLNWRGTPEQFYSTYKAVATGVKAADPMAQIGGPTIAVTHNSEQPFREGFLSYVRSEKLPLDFFSWHWYAMGQDPYDYIVMGREIRTLLDKYGFTATKSDLDEWSYHAFGPGSPDDAHLAAFIETVDMYLQDAPIDIAVYYRADWAFGLDGESKPRAAQALLTMGRLTDTPKRLDAKGTDNQGFAVEAGASESGDLIQIVISNYQLPEKERGPRNGPDEMTLPDFPTFKLLPRQSVDYSHSKGYDLSLSGLDPRKSYRLERYSMSPMQEFAKVEDIKVSGSISHISHSMQPDSTELLVLRKQD